MRGVSGGPVALIFPRLYFSLFIMLGSYGHAAVKTLLSAPPVLYKSPSRRAMSSYFIRLWLKT